MIHPQRWFTEAQTPAKLQRWWNHDKFILLCHIPFVCAAEHVHAFTRLVLRFFSVFTNFYLNQEFISFWSGYRCSSGWGPFLFRLWGQSHCSSQGQPGRRDTLPEQTLALCTGPRHPASLAVLRGGGQQWWGGGWCIHDRLKRILHTYLTFLLSLFTDFLFVVFDKLLFMCHRNSIRMLPLSLLNSIVRRNMFYSSRSAFDSQILRWTRRASLTFPLGEHQMIHKSTAPGLYGPFPCQSHNDPEQHLTPGLHLLAAVKASAG